MFDHLLEWSSHPSSLAFAFSLFCALGDADMHVLIPVAASQLAPFFFSEIYLWCNNLLAVL